MKTLKHLSMALVACIVIAASGIQSRAADQPTYTVARSHYAGWEPWDYIESSGILKKWSDKYGVKIKLTPWMDYVPSMELYTAGKAVGCLMTNMDALTMPAVGGVDSTALIMGDFSNGNDGIVLRKGTSIKDLKGRKVLLVELTVSDYMLSRGLGQNGMADSDVVRVNTADSAIVSAFAASPVETAIVTWNPLLMQARNLKGATMVFDSSKIPGEIMDLLVIRTDAPAAVKKALVGAWYEAMGIMSGQGKATDEAIADMAKSAGGSLAEFQAQLKTTRMFYDSKDAVAFTKGDGIKKTMELVRTFSFDHGLYGQSLTSKDAIGIEFADKAVLGNKNNVKLRFDSVYMQLAAEGKL
ncbi:MAG: putative urea ABC transporter substrate-binding protein [Candidatus Paceibacterota bacterium]|jgi:NitT/TauT family transport system substrate-binding protein